MKVGIVGIGHVGSAMKDLFKDACLYDKYKNIGSKSDINKCNAVFVCVPTPQKDNGACDTSAVEEVLEWVKVDLIIIRSTVPVGFTKKMNDKYAADIVFQPEYYGETLNHPLADLKKRSWLTFGGEKNACSKAIDVYKQVYTSDINICVVDANEAELAKYMENAYFAMKVTFCNEFYDIAQKLGCSYDVARIAWCMDPRIEDDHTFVYQDKRGYSGSCLPKDISAIIYQAKQRDVDVTLLESVKQKNSLYNPNLK